VTQRSSASGLRVWGVTVWGVTFWAVLAAACTAPRVESPAVGRWLPSGEVAAERPAATGQTRPIELATILRLAGERALETRLAEARAAAAKAELDYATSTWLPTLSPRVTVVRHEGQLQSTEGVFFDVDKRNAFGGAGVDVQFNLAEAWYRSIAAEQRSNAARLGIQIAQHMNVGEAVRLYYDLLEATANLQISQRAVAQSRELVSVQVTSEAAGRALDADVLRAKAFLARARGRQASVEADVMEKTARLAGLLVLRNDTRLVPTETTVAPIEFAESALPLPVLLERAMSSRPEVAQARSRIAAAETDVDRENWAWLVPELRLGAEYGAFGRGSSSTHGREDYFADLSWRIGFGGFAKSRHADARFRSERTRMEIVVQDLRRDIQIAIGRVNSGKARMRAAREEILAATAALKLVKLRHEAGKVLLLEVLDAERGQIEASISLVRSICAQNRAQFELHRLLGVN
jgi:outer membrane protein TolC